MAAPKRKRISAEQRRSLLLDAAFACFGRHGYAGTTMDSIAAEAGVSKALIYEHFASKGEVAGALLDREMPVVRETVLAAVTAADDPLDRLRGGLRAFFDWVASRPALFRMAIAEATHDPELERRREEGRARVIEALIVVITAQAEREGREPHFAPLIARALAGAAERVALDATAEGGLADGGRLDAEVLTQVFWLGLERLSRGDRLPLAEAPEGHS